MIAALQFVCVLLLTTQNTEKLFNAQFMQVHQ